MPKLPNPVPLHLIGEAAAQTRPGDDPSLFGTATLEGPSIVEVRSYQTFAIRYRVGKLGLDDTGGIRIALRGITDAGPLQASDPSAPNYVTATSTGDGTLSIAFAPRGGQRPWSGILTINQRGGYLNPGQEITITLGNTCAGSPGMLMPTFYDSGFVFRVMADVQATGVFEPLPDSLLSIAIVAGPLDHHVATLPTLRRVGEAFHLGLKAEDLWGNPTAQGPTHFKVTASLPVKGLPDEIDFSPDTGAMTLENLSVQEAGELRLTLTDPEGRITTAGPLVIRAGDVAQYWGDLHGQTGETVGTNTVDHYFDFARNKSFLDVTSHQANDFQINAEFWTTLNTLTARLNEPGRFTVFPGYEWSGNTAVGGDHNVFYLDEGAPIYRCSHALLRDRSDAQTDAHTLTDLYGKLNAEPIEAVMYAHVGGRYANIFYDHDPGLEAAVEMHSAWGSFEWILTDGFPLRRRVGVVCNSDGHKGRPGASYPGASYFGAYGGLTCFVAPENTRASIFEAIRRRHTYGTSGPRVFVDITAQFASPATLYHRNPIAQPDTPSQEVTQCTLGDIVRLNDAQADIALDIRAPVGIEKVELRNGTTPLETRHSYGASDLGRRIRVMWSGAEYRGRGRNSQWQGRATFEGARIARFEPVNKLNHEATLKQTGSGAVIWKAVTTGNRMGFDVWLDETEGASLDIRTNFGDLSLALGDIGLEPVVMQAGGLARALQVQRLPDAPLGQDLTFQHSVKIAATGDNPIWIAATLEDGNQIWTSPMYLHRD